MADEDKNKIRPEEAEGDFVEKRWADRYRVPSVYQRYITMLVKSDADFVPVTLGDFSRSGILFMSPAPFSADSHAECLISIPQLLSKDITIGIHVKYCQPQDGSFLVGAAIDTVADAVWFEMFVEIHDFIVQRQDSVY